MGIFLVFAHANVEPQLAVAANQVRRVKVAVDVTRAKLADHSPGVASPHPAQNVPSSRRSSHGPQRR